MCQAKHLYFKGHCLQIILTAFCTSEIGNGIIGFDSDICHPSYKIVPIPIIGADSFPFDAPYYSKMQRPRFIQTGSSRYGITPIPNFYFTISIICKYCPLSLMGLWLNHLFL